MYPGQVARLTEDVVASTTSITQTADLMRITGSTAIATIVPKTIGVGGTMVVLVPTDGAVATTTAGNIAVVVSMPQNRATLLVYCKATEVWYPGAIS